MHLLKIISIKLTCYIYGYIIILHCILCKKTRKTLTEQEFAFAYDEGAPKMSGDDFVVLDPKTTDLESGKTYEIRVEAMEKGVRAGRAFFKLTVNAPV